MDTISTLAKTISKNHLEVCQRLTAIESTAKVNQLAYGDIPKRVRQIETQFAWLKGLGATVTFIWTAILTFFGLHHH